MPSTCAASWAWANSWSPRPPVRLTSTAGASSGPSPRGLVLGVPTDLDALAASGAVSPEGVARAGQDLTMGADRGPTGVGRDESVGELVRRRVGDEVFERLVAPLLSGVHAGNADQLSVAAGALAFAAALRGHDSLMAGLAAQRQAVADPDAPVLLRPGLGHRGRHRRPVGRPAGRRGRAGAGFRGQPDPTRGWPGPRRGRSCQLRDPRVGPGRPDRCGRGDPDHAPRRHRPVAGAVPTRPGRADAPGRLRLGGAGRPGRARSRGSIARSTAAASWWLSPRGC